MCSSLTSVTHSLPVRFKMEMGGDGKRERRGVKINFLREECGCYPSQLESAGSHTRETVNI